MKNASTQVDATNIAWERAKRLLREEAGSKRSVDETQAQHELAQKTFEAAEARLRLLAQAVGDAETGAAAPIIIESPEDGLLRNVNAMPEQTVPGGAPLLEVIDLHLVWVRVPIYVGDQDTISTMADAVIGNLTSKPGEFTMTAKPVDAPPSANALASTIDLYYSLPNPAGRLTPGQRVGVNISLRGEEKSLTLPWSAVVHDIYGGTWVYEQTKPSTYERRRVTVRDVVANDAVLATGPAVGTVVVAEGAQELFGAETGFSK